MIREVLCATVLASGWALLAWGVIFDPPRHAFWWFALIPLVACYAALTRAIIQDWRSQC